MPTCARRFVGWLEGRTTGALEDEPRFVPGCAPETTANELIVAAHFSTRYHPNEVRKLLDNKLPPELKARMKLWV